MRPKTIYQTSYIGERKGQQRQAFFEIDGVNPEVGTITASTNPIQVNTSTTTSASFTDPGALDAPYGYSRDIQSKGCVSEPEAVKGDKYGLATIQSPVNDIVSSVSMENRADTILNANRHILTISSIHTCILPDTLKVYEKSLILIYGPSRLGEQYNVYIKDILQVKVRTGLVFASLGVSLKEKSNIAHQIDNLRIAEAKHACDIIDGLIRCTEGNIDTSKYEVNVLINKMYFITNKSGAVPIAGVFCCYTAYFGGSGNCRVSAFRGGVAKRMSPLRIGYIDCETG